MRLSFRLAAAMIDYEIDGGVKVISAIVAKDVRKIEAEGRYIRSNFKRHIDSEFTSSR